MGALAPWVGLRLRGVSALRRAPLLTPSPAGVRVPICEFGGDTSIQTSGVSQPPNRVEPAPWRPLTAGVHRGCLARCGQWRQRLGWASWGVSGDVKPCAGGGRLLPARAPPETVRLWWSPLAPGSVLDLHTWFLSRSPRCLQLGGHCHFILCTGQVGLQGPAAWSGRSQSLLAPQYRGARPCRLLTEHLLHGCLWDACFHAPGILPEARQTEVLLGRQTRKQISGRDGSLDWWGPGRMKSR